MLLEYKSLNTPVGKMVLVANQEKLLSFSWGEASYFHTGAELKKARSNALLTSVEEQLKSYFSRKTKTFKIPLQLQGTEFQEKAWNVLREIPYGVAISYAEQARRVGNPRATRAIGSANGKNPIAIIVPCHRVIGANGKLSGFGGGVWAKEFLLSLENVKIN